MPRLSFYGTIQYSKIKGILELLCAEGERDYDYDDFFAYSESYNLPGGKASLNEHLSFLENLDLVELNDVVEINPLYSIKLCKELSNDFDSFIFKMLIEKEDKIPIRLKKALDEVIASSCTADPVYSSQFVAWVDGDRRDAKNIRRFLVDVGLLIEEEDPSIEKFRVNGKYVLEKLSDNPDKLVAASLRRLLSEKGRMEKTSVVTELVKRLGMPRRTVHFVIDKVASGEIEVEGIECRQMVGGLCIFRFMGK